MRAIQVASLSVAVLCAALGFSAQARANSFAVSGYPQNFTLTALNESMDTLQSIEIATSNSDGTTDWASLIDDALTSESVFNAYSDTIADQTPSADAGVTASAGGTRAAIPTGAFGASASLSSSTVGASPDNVGVSAPEPNSMALTAFGVFGAAGLCLRRRRTAA